MKKKGTDLVFDVAACVLHDLFHELVDFEGRSWSVLVVDSVVTVGITRGEVRAQGS